MAIKKQRKNNQLKIKENLENIRRKKFCPSSLSVFSWFWKTNITRKGENTSGASTIAAGIFLTSFSSTSPLQSFPSQLYSTIPNPHFSTLHRVDFFHFSPVPYLNLITMSVRGTDSWHKVRSKCARTTFAEKSLREQRNESAQGILYGSPLFLPAVFSTPSETWKRYEAVIALKWTWVTQEPPLPYAE